MINKSNICNVQIGVVIENTTSEFIDDINFITQRNYLLDFELDARRLGKEHKVLRYIDGKEVFVIDELEDKEQFMVNYTFLSPKKRFSNEIEFRLWCAGLYQAQNYDYPQYEIKTRLEELEEDNSNNAYIPFLKGNKKAWKERSIIQPGKITIFLYNIERYATQEYRKGLKNDFLITNDFFSKYGLFKTKKHYFEKELESENSQNFFKWRNHQFLVELEYPITFS
tara:strand:- start:59 stop:733 length:675 start_codon:yes stop_codon:yes gene_type:complete